MTELKLQVGKTYRSRSGSVEKIVRYEDGHRLPFMDENACGYSESGQFFPDGSISDYDLIEEIE